MTTDRITVKDLLVEAKDVSELMVDLAYAGIFFGDDDIAREVLNLREELTWVVQNLRTMAMLAARSREDAQAMAGVLRMVAAMDKIGDAAEDIARVVLKELGIPPGLRDDLRHAEEVIARVRLREENALAGKSLEDAELPTETGMWVIAIRRDVSWVFGPEGNEVLRPGDIIFAQGPEEGVNLLRELAGAPPRSLGEPVSRTLTGLDRAVDVMVEMKNASEVAVGLAYSAVLLHDKGLAAEVGAIEDATDEMHHELERWVLRSVQEGAEPDDLRGLLHLGFASERIADAAQEMTRITETEEIPHPVIAEALAEADEIVVQATVMDDGAAAGRTLRALSLRTELGMEVLAVKRADRWTYRPRGSLTLQPGDRLIAIGPQDGVQDMEDLFGMRTYDEED
ncbi:MAG TPA: TrkA C-terminal domain-containing protein [Actinomycetota bacterium]